MRIWRIGSKWGPTDILPIFKKRNIAFASSDVADAVKDVEIGDVIAITKGQKIEGIARVSRIEDLKDFDPNLAKDFDNVKVLIFNNLFLQEESAIDFGHYGGQGKQFHEAHNSYALDIKRNYYHLINQKMEQDIITLLKYKKQIILQGPPGTGKTFTAENVALEMIREKQEQKPIDEINDFFRSHNIPSEESLKVRNEQKEKLSEFQSTFSLGNLKKMGIDDYVIGKGGDTFSWWIEYGLKELGGYSGQAGKFKIYWSKKSNSYEKVGFVKDIEDDEEAAKEIFNEIIEVLEETDLKKSSKRLSDGFILKILHSYYPDKYFPINNEKCINNALKLLQVDPKGKNVFEKNLLVQQLFEDGKNNFKVDVTNIEFMNFLFHKFDMQGEIKLKQDVLITKGEYKIIQFHPAYSYEDFVRGIITEIDSKNQVQYKVVNKILVEYAEKAMNNSSADYVLIIDEINRANLPSVLGELIYALEYRYDKEKPEKAKVESPYAIKENEEDDKGNREIALPDNLYIIGTMNTADRSVGHIDYAIRRRFGFFPMLPSSAVIKKVITNNDLQKKSLGLYHSVRSLFDIENISAEFDARDVQIGHSYFLADSEKDLQLKLDYEIKPILEEYLKDGIFRQQVTFNGREMDTAKVIESLKI